jgi:5-methyltetrahydrofolate--homocysteine methyltransferase
MMGVSGKQAAETLWPLGLSAIGANCGEGIQPVALALQQMHAALPEAPLIAKPNAGLPKIVGGETLYDLGPHEFTPHMVDFVQLGAQVIGACCGSNPHFIREISQAEELRLK